MDASASESADAQSRRASHDDLPHLSDLEWRAIGRVAETVGDTAVESMLCSLNGNDQHATIAKLIQHKLDELQKTMALSRKIY